MGIFDALEKPKSGIFDIADRYYGKPKSGIFEVADKYYSGKDQTSAAGALSLGQGPVSQERAREIASGQTSRFLESARERAERDLYSRTDRAGTGALAAMSGDLKSRGAAIDAADAEIRALSGDAERSFVFAENLYRQYQASPNEAVFRMYEDAYRQFSDAHARLGEAQGARERQYSDYAAREEQYAAAMDSYNQRLAQRREETLAALEEGLGSREAAERYMGYLQLQGNEDFAEKSAPRENGTRNGQTRSWVDVLLDNFETTGYDDPLYDYVNGDTEALNAMQRKAGGRYGANGGSWAALFGIGEAANENIPNMTKEQVATFNYLYETQGPQAAREYLDFAVGDTYTGFEALNYGLMQGSGLTSATQLISAAVGANDVTNRLAQDAAAAGAQHPAAYAAGNIAGNLALMYGIGAAAGKGVNALMGGRSVTLTTAGTTMNITPFIAGAATNALTFTALDAVHNAGALASGNMSGGDFVKSLGVSAASGIAGGLAQGLAGTGIAVLLKNKGLMTPFGEFVRLTAAGMANSSAYIGTNYALREEKPSGEEIATQFVTAFAFSVLSGLRGSMAGTEAAKAEFDRDLEITQELYSKMSADWDSLSPAARAAQAERISGMTQQIRGKLNSVYLAGQQTNVDKLNAALDVIDAAMQQYAAGFAGAAPPAQVDPETAAMIANAVQEGLSVRTNAPAPTAAEMQTGSMAPAAAAISAYTPGATSPEAGLTARQVTPGAAPAQPQEQIVPGEAPVEQEGSFGDGQVMAATAEEMENGRKLAPTAYGAPETAPAQTARQNNAAPGSGTAIQDYQRQSRYGEMLNQIRAHLSEIQNDAPVAVITGNEFQKTDGDDPNLRKKVINFFNSIGNKVFRKGMGDIALNAAGVHDSLAHGYGRLKAATFAALPNVLTDGKLISTRGPYEGHNYDSFFIAAPVTVGEEKVYVGALVIKDDKTQRYKLHEVLTINKSGAPLFQSESGENTGPLRNGTPPEGPFDSPASDDTLSPGAKNVKSVDSDGNILLSEKGPEVTSDSTPARGGTVLPPALDSNPQSSAITAGNPTVSETSETPLESLGTTDSRVSQGAENVNTGSWQPQNLMTYAEYENSRNGGSNNERGNRAADGAAGAVPDRSNERTADQRAGGQDGRLGRGAAERRAVAGASQVQTANQRQNTGRSLRLEKISSRELGLSQGTDPPAVAIMPEDAWDAEMQETAARVEREAGKRVTFVLGSIPIRKSGGGTARVRGVNMADGIIIQADHTRLSVSQIADHEIYHEISAHDAALNATAEERITEQYGREAFDKVLDKYIESLNGIIDLPENATPAEIEAAIAAIKDEIMADAYAGINAFGAHAEQFGGAVNDTMGDRWGMRSGQNAAATDRTTGPPRYSLNPRFAAEIDDWDGKSDRTFDVGTTGEALQSIGVADREIIWRSRKIAEILRKHQGMTLDIIKRVPEILENPIAVLKSRQSDSRIVLFGELKDENGAPVTAIVELQPTTMGGELLDMNVVVSAYGKDSGPAAFVENSDLLYLDPNKNRTGKWMQGLGLQLPSDTTILGSVGTVTYQDGKVKIEGVPYKQYMQGAASGNMDARYSVDDDYIPQSAAEYVRMKRDQPQEATEGSEKRKKTQKPVAESRPIIAKQDLKRNLMGLFSIPEGKRAEIGSIIDYYADKIAKAGGISQKDYDAFFDRMYAEGVMTVPADEYQRIGRAAVQGGRIYVSDGIKADFGDDWNTFRKRAFAAGIYLTGDIADRGADSWNMELAEDFPGIFDPEDLDERGILEKIVQMAEEGKDEKMSLSEYAAMIAGRDYISEDEMLDNMERQMDWALRTYAEKAELEVKLRDRTGVKIAQEREKAADRVTRERAAETQRRAKDRDRRKDMAQKQRDNRELREMQQKTLKQLQWLSRNRQRAPEELKATWDDVLSDIDIYAASAADGARWSGKYQATWQELADIYKRARDEDPNFLPSKDLERIVARLDNRKIGDMDIDALRDLYQAAVGLRTEFYNRNNVINDAEHRLFADVYESAKQELSEAKGGYQSGARGVASKIFDDMQLTPMNFLERMAGWNPDSQWYSMAQQLEAGERTMRRFQTRAKNMLAPFLTEHADWAKTADGQGKDAVWYELEVPELLELGMGDKPIFGNTVKVYMTPAQKVHMYLESKNYDNLRHMAGGRTFADRELYSKGKRAEAFAQGKTVKLAPETVKKIVSSLTPEETALAQALEPFYNDYSKSEINRVSNALYGFDKAMSGPYAPIYTNQNYVKSEPGIFDATAEGVGNLKARQYAKNPSLNISAFDAFERSVERTSRFVGMAIPVRNWNTLMNWRESSNSMGDVITHKWGEGYKKFINDLLTELQGGREIKTGKLDSLMNSALSKYISAVFGFNPSIVFKQFASYPLAAAYLGWENMPKWVPGAAQVDMDLIGKYTGELDYRLMGYATPETATLKDHPGKLQERGPLNFMFGGGSITWMDGFTVRTIWTWAENKVKREYPDLEIGTQEQIDAGQSRYYKAVAKEFEEAVSRSQPMYDIMHRSNIMRESGGIARTFTLFKTVPQQEYNMLRQALGEQRHYKKHGTKEQRREANRKTGRAAMGIVVGNLTIGAVTFLNALLKNKAKTYRDDDGELTVESFLEQFGNQFLRDSAGLSIGGDVLADAIGAMFGDRWYGIETPGIEQIGTILEQLIDAGKTVGKLVGDSIEVLNSGGDWLQYMRDHSDVYLSAVEETARTITTYATGLPADNVKAYLLGALQWLSPEIKTAYEDAFDKADKSGLKGLTGAALETRMGHLLQDRARGASDEAIKALAELYEAGYTDAAPAAQQEKITVNGEERVLNIAQQQTYKNVWSGTVGGALDELVATETFQSADPEAREKMVKRLYDYAAERAKEVLFDDYEIKSTAEKADSMIDAGASAAEWAAWSAESSGQDRATQYDQIISSDLSDKAKIAAIGNIIGTDMETESGKPSQWAKLNEAVGGGCGVDDAARMLRDGTLDAYLKLAGAGLKPKDAYQLANALGALEPEEGRSGVSDLQRYQAIIDAGISEAAQMDALAAVMPDSTYAKLEIGYRYGVTPEAWVTLKTILPQFDADGSGGYSQAEVQAAIDSFGTSGGGLDWGITLPTAGDLALTNDQKAALWQIITDGKNGKNNPYSTSIGKEVYDAMHGAAEDDNFDWSAGIMLPTASGLDW